MGGGEQNVFSKMFFGGHGARAAMESFVLRFVSVECTG